MKKPEAASSILAGLHVGDKFQQNLIPIASRVSTCFQHIYTNMPLLQHGNYCQIMAEW